MASLKVEHVRRLEAGEMSDDEAYVIVLCRARPIAVAMRVLLKRGHGPEAIGRAIWEEYGDMKDKVIDAVLQRLFTRAARSLTKPRKARLN